MVRYTRGRRGHSALMPLFFLAFLLLAGPAFASIGDRLPEFRKCVEICKHENCGSDAKHYTPIPLHRRLLLWTCPAECDYTCQHITTAARQSSTPPQPVVQFHGKWPFRRLWGAQEPASVLFSLGNLAAHYHGLHARVLPRIPPSYTMRPFYVALARLGMLAWLLSAVFHTRDFPLTEQLDYLAAGASVLYGMYYAVVRVARLDRPTPAARRGLRLWTAVCGGLYVAHVAYLKLWRWDYAYNTLACVVCGVVQNLLWSWFSWTRYASTGKAWAAWPGLVVAWVIMAMSLELFDFAPIWGSFDAHSLWHLGTIAPAVLWYK
ncbi:Per1-domain-containing protein [Parathielavia hyrcaniae]|uniref:Post-GPI attachment to proteins factor 3 n=1 Tax=Parathielavia hyrcaniae TaxID=113614 RepID=A0AAN6T5K5_9PEZI|nr:Per1-domain-containing protein [Parathielavia hyrcaniae]